MSGSTDSEGVHGIKNKLEISWIWSEPGREIVQISAERWGAAPGDEAAARVHGACPLPMGIEREDRCE